MRDLYAFAADRWVAEGARLHLALVPALLELVEPWLRLGFAYMQAHGIRESGGQGAAPTAGVSIRVGTIDDLPEAWPLLPLIWEHQRGSATFTGMEIPSEAEYVADWEETLADPIYTYFVGELDGRIAGHLLIYPEEPDLATPPGSVYLAVAATLPEARGRGLGVALTEHALRGRARPAMRRCTPTGASRTSSRPASGPAAASGRPSTGSRGRSRSARGRVGAPSAKRARHSCVFQR